MRLNALGYVGVYSDKLDDWATYGPQFLGLELVERIVGTLNSAWTIARSGSSFHRRPGGARVRLGGREGSRARGCCSAARGRKVEVSASPPISNSRCGLW